MYEATVARCAPGLPIRYLTFGYIDGMKEGIEE